MKKSMILACGVAALCASSAMAQFVNGSFEDNGGSFDGWITFETAFITDSASHNGSGHSAKLYGNGGGGYNVAGCFQDLPAAPGQVWVARGYFLTPGTDSVAGNANFAVMNIEWHRADGSMISYISTTGLNGLDATADIWYGATVAGTAPAGTTVARIVPLFLNPNGGEFGSILVDDLSFYQLGCDADFNHDGVVDFFDYLDFVDAFSIGC